MDNVANDLGMSRAFLSYAENGQKTLRKEDFIRFLDFYDISFNFDSSITNEIHNLLDEMVSAFIYRNQSYGNEVVKRVVQNEEKYKYSLGCIYLSLINIFPIDPERTMRERTRLFDEAESLLPLYSADEKALFTFVKAYELGKQEKYDLSISLYYEALNYFEGRQWPQLEGIIKVNLGTILTTTVSYFEGYKITNEALDIFVRRSNYVRALICQSNIASYLTQMQCYGPSEEISNKILLSKETFSNPLIYTCAIRVKLMTLTLSEKFYEAIQFAQTHQYPFPNGFISNFCLIPYCYYRTGQFEECLSEIKKLSKEKPTADDKALFSLLKAIIRQDKPGVEKEKKRMEKICCRQYNWPMLKILYQLLIYYYTDIEDKDMLIDSYAKQAMVFSHKLPLPDLQN